MQETYYDRQSNINEDQVDIREIFHVLLQGKSIIISVTALASIFAVIFSLLLPNIYESRALLAPTDSSSGISGALSSYSGLASIAGINLPTQDQKSNSGKAMMKLNTLSFFENNVMPAIFLPDLMALKSWDFKTNKLIYDESIYNIDTMAWVRDDTGVNQQIPSAQESFRLFQAHVNLSIDTKTSFVTLTVKHQSPYIAKEWAELLIKEINAFYREKDKLESQKSVIYLNAQIVKTNLSEIKYVIAGILQQETQKLTLIEANESYVFDYIDPPAVMEQKIEPKRSLICIIGSILGGILSIFIVLIRYYIFSEKASQA